MQALQETTVRCINFHCHPPIARPGQGGREEDVERMIRSPEIDLWCISPLDLRHLSPDPEYPYMTDEFRSDNAGVARLRERYPEKILPFVYVDPRGEGAAETVRRWVEHEGFRGLKLYPPIGFYPDAAELVPFFEAVDDLKIPILFHSGRVAPHPELRCKYANPLFLEGAAYAARHCTVVVGHAGHPWNEVTYGLVMGVRNMVIDLTTGGSWDLDWVSRMVKDPYIGAERIVWGSDGVWNALDELKRFREALASGGLGEEELDGIFYGTAARILGV